MAPRTRAAARRENANRGSNYNTRGFVKLPLEIIYRIVSAAQGAIIPCVNEAAMDKKYSERRDSLLALSQVCQSLRVALLPLLWERLEACCLPDNQDNQKQWRRLTKKLAGQLEVISVIKPSYASYVRIVNITIEPRVASEMLFNLAPALTLMPNLHTIQIVIDPNFPKFRTCNIFVVGSAVFRNAFKDHLYPSVKRAVLPGQAMTVLQCCPEVREVCLNQPYQNGFFDFLEYLAKSCTKLERFGWMDSEFEEEEGSRAAAAEKLLNICGLEYYMKELNDNEISQLAGLQNLEDLCLIIDAYDDLAQCDDTVLEVIEAAKKVLVASSSINRRLDVMLRAETRSFTLGKNQDSASVDRTND